MIKTVAGTIGFLVLAVVLATTWNTREETNKDLGRDRVVITVEFTPSPRDKMVGMSVTVNTKPVLQDNTLHSGWTHSRVVEKHQIVAVVVTQEEAGAITCTMTRNGVPTRPGHRMDRGPIGCRA